MARETRSGENSVLSGTHGRDNYTDHAGNLTPDIRRQHQPTGDRRHAAEPSSPHQGSAGPKEAPA